MTRLGLSNLPSLSEIHSLVTANVEPYLVLCPRRGAVAAVALSASSLATSTGAAEWLLPWLPTAKPSMPPYMPTEPALCAPGLLGDNGISRLRASLAAWPVGEKITMGGCCKEQRSSHEVE